MYQKGNIGMFGFGTIGTAVYKYLKTFYDPEKTGLELTLSKICVRNLTKPRGIKIDQSLLTTKPEDILDDPSIDVVVEVMGGIDPAGVFILEALKNKKHVVTANKALLTYPPGDAFCSSEEYAESLKNKRWPKNLGGYMLFTSALSRNLNIGFEASVCGEIPVIETASNLPSRDYVRAIEGIVNGTCNFIMTKKSQGKSDDVALKGAQAKGLTEADPSSDVDGKDASQKLAILSTLIFGKRVEVSQIICESIRPVTTRDMKYAKDMGYVIKPLAFAKKHPGERLELRVGPTLVPKRDILSSVDLEMNAVSLYFKGRKEPMTLYGAGAGPPTASSVVKDIVAVLKQSPESRASIYNLFTDFSGFKCDQPSGFKSHYYLRLSVIDKPSVMSYVTNILGQHKINIEEFRQIRKHKVGDIIPMAMLLGSTTEGNMNHAVEEIRDLNKKENSSPIKEVLKMRVKGHS